MTEKTIVKSETSEEVEPRYREIITALSERLDELREITSEMPRAQNIIGDAKGSLRSAERIIESLVATLKILANDVGGEIKSKADFMLENLEDIPIVSGPGDELS